MTFKVAFFLLCLIFTTTHQCLSSTRLLLDLDADKNVKVNPENKVTRWANSVTHQSVKDFIGQDKGRKVKESGLPEWGKADPQLGGHRAVHFRQQELVSEDEDTFDGLTTGKGYTWFCVVSVSDQRVGLKDVNSFFGNLRNGSKYEGLWACVEDDNTLWVGARNGKTFGRFDVNNPKLTGPVLQKNRYYLVASRMHKGEGKTTVELFLNNTKPIATAQFPVNSKANPSKMVVGQERDAIEHPGKESFDGSIARLMIYEGGLDDTTFKKQMTELIKTYQINTGK